MISFPFKRGTIEPITGRMAQGTADKSVSIDELRETTGSLKAWRTGALVRLARKQTEQVIRRETRRSRHAAAARRPTP